MAAPIGEDEVLGSSTLAQRTRARLELIIDASIAFAATTSEETLAAELAGIVALAYGAEESVVYLAGPDGMLRPAAGSDPLGGTVVPELLPGSGVVKVSAADGAGAMPVLAPALQRAGIHAVLAAPLQHLGEDLGLFACFFRHPRRFDEEASPLALALGGQAAQSIANLRMRRTLEHAALHDTITGLPNRRHLEHRAATPGGGDLAVLFLDLDGFKDVNDRLGHPAGDRVLREVAGRLQATVREDDFVARYGGDEFVVVCEVNGPEDAAQIAERLRAAVREPYAFLPPGLGLGVSVGMAMTGERAGIWSVDRLIRLADQAMYKAKNAGGDRVEVALAS